MRLITTTYRIRRWTRADLTGFQRLQRVTRLLGIPVWIKTIDEEDVPSWAFIQKACLGYSDWKSRLFRQHADKLEGA